MNEPTVDRIVSAIRLVDERLAAAEHPEPLRALRDRLVGELVGDAGLAIGTLAEGFELVTSAGGVTSVTAREALVESLHGLARAAGGSLMWLEVDDLVSDGSAVAANGRLCTLKTAEAAGRDDVGPRDALASSTPVAIFCRCEGSAMTTEVLHAGGGLEAVVLRDVALPTLEEIRAAIA